MSTHPKTLLPFIFSIFLFSCNEGNEEVECNEYFLNAESSGDYITKIFYNEIGQVSALESKAGSVNTRLDVYYDQDQRIKQVKNIEQEQVTEFFLDVSGRLVSTVRYLSGARLDSFAIEYDDSERIIKRSIYKDQPPNTYVDSYYTVEYPGDKAMKVNFYKRVASTIDTFEHTGTFSYTMDDKSRPYPEAYYSIYLSWTNVVLPNNIMSLEISDKNGTVTSNQTYEYSYNSAGYPLQRRTIGSIIDYQYSCNPTVE